MLFSSITFLYYFLPVTLLLYFAVPEKGKNLILFLASFLFYSWGEPKYSILLLLSVGIGYLGGRLIERTAFLDKKTGRKKKAVTGVFIAVTLSFLIFFKYADFLIKTINAFAGTQMGLLRIALPIGISFYSFQIISYYIDVSRGEVSAEKNIIDFAAYVTMFPQLIAGPVVRFESVQKELKKRDITLERISDGAAGFVCGLCKKVLIADSLAELVSYLERAKSVSGLGTAGYWVLALAFMLQLYYDFSGYSDMAIGLGKILGFTFPENFCYPYISKSISEFWRRWHMTLGGWFRDYLYIPLGGNRVGFLRWCINMFLVWFLSGLWHGAGWNFALWGIYFGIFLSVEKLCMKKSGVPHEKNRFLRAIGHVYVWLVVLVSFVIFRVESVSGIYGELSGLMGRSHTVMSQAVGYEIRNYALLLVFAVIGAMPAVSVCKKRMCKKPAGKTIAGIVQGIATLAGLVLATAFLMGSSVHPFLYFRF